MSQKLTIFLAIDDDNLLREIEPLLDTSKYVIESYRDEAACIDNLNHNPDIILIDYHLNNNSDQKEKKSVDIIEKIKEHKLNTRVFMFSDKDSARLLLNIIEKK